MRWMNAVGSRGSWWGHQKMEWPRFTVLHPEGSYNATKDIVERLLMEITCKMRCSFSRP